MLYVVGLLTVGLVWLFDITTVLRRPLPRIPLFGMDVGFYVVHFAIFGGIWFLVWFLRETGFIKRSWIDGIASRQGGSRFVDLLLLVTSITLGAVASGNGTLAPYLRLMLMLTLVTSATSLLTGRERRLLPIGISTTPPDDGTVPDAGPAGQP